MGHSRYPEVKREGEEMNGLLVIDKPSGMTSRDVVNRVLQWFPRKTKLGHTGTLDPLATGVLVVCIGAATRLAEYVQAMGKCYHARVRLGATSNTDDADGDITSTRTLFPIPIDQVAAAIHQQVGFIEQRPPQVSALKLGGKRAHQLARMGHEVALASRWVQIDSIQLLSYEWPFVEIEVNCGKGTYIRSIARDVGAALHCGGLVETLRRTRVGPFLAEQGVGLERRPQNLSQCVLPMVSAVPELEQIRLELPDRLRLCRGMQIAWNHGDPRPIAVVDEADELVAIATATGSFLLPKIVLVRPDDLLSE